MCVCVCKCDLSSSLSYASFKMKKKIENLRFCYFAICCVFESASGKVFLCLYCYFRLKWIKMPSRIKTEALLCLIFLRSALQVAKEFDVLSQEALLFASAFFRLFLFLCLHFDWFPKAIGC